jgi:hypothetical protein
MRSVISAEQATVMIYRIMDVLRRNIHDKRILLAIGREIQSMVAKGAVDVNEVPEAAVEGQWELDGEEIDLKVGGTSEIISQDIPRDEETLETPLPPGPILDNPV